MKNTSIILFFLLIFDVLGFLLAHQLGYKIRFGQISALEMDSFVFLFITISIFYVFGCYFISYFDSKFRLLSTTIIALLLTSILITSYIYWVKPSSIYVYLGRGVMLYSLLLFAAYILITRVSLSFLLWKKNRLLEWDCYGNKEHFIQLKKDAEELKSTSFEFNYIGFDENLGESSEVGVILLSKDDLPTELKKEITKNKNKLLIMTITDFYEHFWEMEPNFYIEEGNYIYSQNNSAINHDINIRIKRLIDIFSSSILLIISTPVIVISGFLIMLTSRGSAIYKQSRVGKKGNIFSLYKLRTMELDAEKNGVQWAKKNDSRVTKVGKLLRRTRIDELPQLYNVLKGEMSLIGPRPERPEIIEKLDKRISYYSMRHYCKPGLSGWAQVKYPYGSSEEDSRRKLQYDLFYIKKYSLALDVIIALKTLLVIFTAKGR